MRLDEFNRNGQKLDNFPKQNDISDQGDIIRYLRNNGWEFSGSGYYSHVYQRPDKNYVIKVNQEYDRSFAYFVFLTHKFPNTHFPVISNVKLLKDNDGDKFYVYIIEKLDKLENEEFMDNRYGIENVFKDIRRNRDIDEQRLSVRFPETYEYLQSNISLWKAIQIMGKYGKGNVDIEYTNTMQRKDGTIVFADPFS